MGRTGFLLYLMHLIGFIGAMLAAIVYWDDERTVAYAAIVAILIILFLSNHLLAEFATWVGFGFLGYALTNSFALSIVASILGVAVMIAIGRVRNRKRDNLLAAHLQAKQADPPKNEVEALNTTQLHEDSSH